jgi:acetyl-CoA decarbonylase/synthase complex subunit gamma
MALTGIEIFKLLPKTNCGKCGVPTCLAFAMSLAAGKAELAACPFVTEESRAKLSEASAPPIRVVTVGTGEQAVKVGGETVFFRHEKRFENPTALAMLITDSMSDSEVEGRLARFKALTYERVGLRLKPDMLAIKCDSGDAARFATLCGHVSAHNAAALILMTDDPGIMEAALKQCAAARPLLYAVTPGNFEAMTTLAKTYNCPVAVRASGIEELAGLTEKMTALGLKDIVIDPGSRRIGQALADQVAIRRLALTKKFRPLGFPTILLTAEMTDNPMKEALTAGVFIAKYGGIVVMSDFQGEWLFPLLVLRMNLFTDPQRPLATTEGIYEIGKTADDSPVLVTSNFSLTYFIVSGEIENSHIPGYLLVKDTEGLSVMTAWAAGKFSADNIAALVKKSGIAERIKHRKLIIPGYIALESGGLEEELPGWEIQVGPREGAHIPAYLKTWKA